MMSAWLNKLLAADDDGTNYTKLVPLLIFFVIWVLGAISKAVHKGKKGTEAEPEPNEGDEEHSFEDLASKIRQRYTEAKEQAEKRASEQGRETTQQPPARPVIKSEPAPVPARQAPRMPPPMYQTGPKQPMFEVTKAQDGPTLKVVKGLEKPPVNVRVAVEKPILQKVEPGIEKVEGITSDVPMVSTAPEIPHLESPYLAELAAQYATRDGFRKAVLNYEIFGPPLSLRERTNSY
jgi:hypothetical protein